MLAAPRELAELSVQEGQPGDGRQPGSGAGDLYQGLGFGQRRCVVDVSRPCRLDIVDNYEETVARSRGRDRRDPSRGLLRSELHLHDVTITNEAANYQRS